MNLYCWGRPYFTVNMRGGGEEIEKITVSMRIIGSYQSVAWSQCLTKLRSYTRPIMSQSYGHLLYYKYILYTDIILFFLPHLIEHKT